MMKAIKNFIYARINKGRKCPFCGDTFCIVTPAHEGIRPPLRLGCQMSCTSCKKEWYDMYELASYSEIYRQGD